jgi:hypothetical protein
VLINEQAAENGRVRRGFRALSHGRRALPGMRCKPAGSRDTARRDRKALIGRADDRSGQRELARNKRFRVAFAGPAFHPSQARQAQECFRIEPMLRALAAKVRNKQINLALH